VIADPDRVRRVALLERDPHDLGVEQPGGQRALREQHAALAERRAHALEVQHVGRQPATTAVSSTNTQSGNRSSAGSCVTATPIASSAAR
jgi:hypothetical protein